MSIADDAKMPLTAHLEELRWRILKALVAVMIAFVGAYNFADHLFAFLAQPLVARSGAPVELIGTGVTEAFFTKLKVSLIAAVFAASPVLFYQAWQFVAPGLYSHEKRYARPFVAAATFFFGLGAGFCYVVVFPVGYAFFHTE
jgi:sec-independent protein translocase protein TatC